MSLDEFRIGPAGGKLTGSSPDTRPKPKQYPAGRICKEDGCKTVLSRYNRSPLCSIHKPPTFRRTAVVRRKKRADAGLRRTSV